MEDIIFDLYFALILGVNTESFIELLEKHGSCKEIFNNLDSIKDGFSNSVINKFCKKDLDFAIKEYENCIYKKIQIISYTDNNYPALLKEADNPPLVIYCKGNLSLLKNPLITIAGSKRCSSEGKDNARKFTKIFSNAGITPVCGFSKGIEAEVCRANEKCVVISPCGLDITYPANQFSIKEKVLENGGLFISELPTGSKALGVNIVNRNRLLAALSPYCLIVEAGENSGTEIIFDNCLAYNRPCFVIPGSIRSQYNKGSNNMLKKGGVVATDPDDIINFYKIAYPFLCNVEFDSPALEDEYTFNSNLGECENAILKLLSVSPEKSETISEKLDFSASETASALTMLEMLGTIEEVNGYFKIV